MLTLGKRYLARIFLLLFSLHFFSVGFFSIAKGEESKRIITSASSKKACIQSLGDSLSHTDIDRDGEEAVFVDSSSTIMPSIIQVVSSTVSNIELETMVVKCIGLWDDFGVCEQEVGEKVYIQEYVFGE